METVPLLAKRLDNSIFHTEISVKSIVLDDQPLQVLTIHTKPDHSQQESISSPSNETDLTTAETNDKEPFFKELFEEAPLAYHALDEKGNIVDVNLAWSELTGYPRQESIGRWFGEFLKPDYQERYRDSLAYFKELGFKSGVQYELIRKDGSSIIVSIDGRIGYDKQGKFRLCHCIIQNITEQKQAEQALRESEEKYRAVLEKSADNIFLMDVET